MIKNYYFRITFYSDLMCNKILKGRNSYKWGSNYTLNFNKKSIKKQFFNKKYKYYNLCRAWFEKHALNGLLKVIDMFLNWYFLMCRRQSGLLMNIGRPLTRALTCSTSSLQGSRNMKKEPGKEYKLWLKFNNDIIGTFFLKLFVGRGFKKLCIPTRNH